MGLSSDNNNLRNNTTWFIKQNLSFLRQQLNLYKQDIANLTKETDELKLKLLKVNFEIDSIDTCVESFRNNRSKLHHTTVKALIELRQTKADLEFQLDKKNSTLTISQSAYENLHNKLKPALKRFSEMHANARTSIHDPNKIFFDQNPMSQKVVTELLVQKDSKTLAMFASSSKFWHEKLTLKTKEPHLTNRSNAISAAMVEVKQALSQLEINKNNARVNFDRFNCKQQFVIDAQLAKLHQLEMCFHQLSTNQNITTEQLNLIFAHKKLFSSSCWNGLRDDVFSFSLDIENDVSAPKACRF